ncbi:MAG: hypothetical protein K8R02_09315 [Anaerohalosphaeraceae bacterium]|nr:hypothetical protein [Anaerohalosphaeraceae bacterium]
MKKIIAILSVAVFCSQFLFGDTLIVDGTQNVPNSYIDINEALQNAQNGDAIAIYPGTYEEYVDLSVKNNITLEGIGDKESVIIQDPNEQSPNDFTIKLGNGCVLKNLTVIHDRYEKPVPDDRCSVLASEINDISLENCCFLRGKNGNSGEQSGEGFGHTVLFKETNNTNISKCLINGNEYGLGIKDGIYDPIRSIHTIIDTDIVTSGYDYMCDTFALELDGNLDVNVTSCVISAELGDKNGGASATIAITNNDAILKIYNSIINSNTPSETTDAIIGLSQSDTDINDSIEPETYIYNTTFSVELDKETDYNYSIWVINGDVFLENVCCNIPYHAYTNATITVLNPDTCMSSCNPSFWDWLEWDKPSCWCYRYNCRGDIDGIQNGPFRVSNVDLQVFLQAFNKTDEELMQINNGICADLNHHKEGPFRVSNVDLQIFNTFFNQGTVDECPLDITEDGDDDYNFWTN